MLQNTNWQSNTQRCRQTRTVHLGLGSVLAHGRLPSFLNTCSLSTNQRADSLPLRQTTLVYHFTESGTTANSSPQSVCACACVSVSVCVCTSQEPPSQQPAPALPPGSALLAGNSSTRLGWRNERMGVTESWGRQICWRKCQQLSSNQPYSI